MAVEIVRLGEHIPFGKRPHAVTRYGFLRGQLRRDAPDEQSSVRRIFLVSVEPDRTCQPDPYQRSQNDAFIPEIRQGDQAKYSRGETQPGRPRIGEQQHAADTDSCGCGQDGP